jgi:hypothetical protein
MYASAHADLPKGGTTVRGITDAGTAGGGDTVGDGGPPDTGMGEASRLLSHVSTRVQGDPFVQSHSERHAAPAGTADSNTRMRRVQRAVIFLTLPERGRCGQASGGMGW